MTERDLSIFFIEENYCERLNDLIENEQFDDAHALFEEFIVDSEEPGSWMFIPFIQDVC